MSSSIVGPSSRTKVIFGEFASSLSLKRCYATGLGASKMSVPSNTSASQDDVNTSISSTHPQPISSAYSTHPQPISSAYSVPPPPGPSTPGNLSIGALMSRLNENASSLKPEEVASYMHFLTSNKAREAAAAHSMQSSQFQFQSNTPLNNQHLGSSGDGNGGAFASGAGGARIPPSTGGMTKLVPQLLEIVIRDWKSEETIRAKDVVMVLTSLRKLRRNKKQEQELRGSFNSGSFNSGVLDALEVAAAQTVQRGGASKRDIAIILSEFAEMKHLPEVLLSSVDRKGVFRTNRRDVMDDRIAREEALDTSDSSNISNATSAGGGDEVVGRKRGGNGSFFGRGGGVGGNVDVSNDFLTQGIIDARDLHGGTDRADIEAMKVLRRSGGGKNGQNQNHGEQGEDENGRRGIKNRTSDDMDVRSLNQLLSACTIFSKLARQAQGSQTGLQSSPRPWETTLESVPAYVCESLAPQIPDFAPIDFSSVAQTLAAAGLGNNRIFCQLICSAQGQLPRFSDRELSNLINAMAKGNRRNEIGFFELVYQSFGVPAAGGIGQKTRSTKLSTFAPQALVTLVNACSRLDVRHAFLLDALAYEVCSPQRRGKFNEAELALLCNGFANLEKRDRALICFLAREIVFLISGGSSGGASGSALSGSTSGGKGIRTRHAAMIVKAFSSPRWVDDDLVWKKEDLLSMAVISGAGSRGGAGGTEEKQRRLSEAEALQALIRETVGSSVVKRVTERLANPDQFTSGDLADLSLGLSHASQSGVFWFYDAMKIFCEGSVSAGTSTGKMKNESTTSLTKDLAIIATSVVGVGGGDLGFWQNLVKQWQPQSGKGTATSPKFSASIVSDLTSFARALRRLWARGEPFQSLAERELVKHCLTDTSLDEKLESAQIHDVCSLFHSLSVVSKAPVDSYLVLRLYLEKLLENTETMSSSDLGLVLSAFSHFCGVAVGHGHHKTNGNPGMGANDIASEKSKSSVGPPNSNSFRVPYSAFLERLLSSDKIASSAFTPKELSQLLRDITVAPVKDVAKKRLLADIQRLIDGSELTSDSSLEILAAAQDRGQVGRVVEFVEGRLEEDFLPPRDENEKDGSSLRNLRRAAVLMNNLARLGIFRERIVDSFAERYLEQDEGTKNSEQSDLLSPLRPISTVDQRLVSAALLDLFVNLGFLGKSAVASDDWILKHLNNINLKEVLRERSTRQGACIIASLALFQHNVLAGNVFRRNLLSLYASGFESGWPDFEHRQLLLTMMDLYWGRHRRGGSLSFDCFEESVEKEASGDADKVENLTRLTLPVLRILLEASSCELPSDSSIVSSLQKDVLETVENILGNVVDTGEVEIEVEEDCYPYSVDLVIRGMGVGPKL